ncbi:MAG: 2-oxoacid:ferredoxin oxidoreductase subunit beta [Lentimicrobiaceae bacterium]|nr:2-oxoacid:ferredoxin oxidoreductase subunit beta [Lentimicrobiaceae bacterium]
MKIAIEKSKVKLSKQDFASDQMVKWCPGCGSYSILAAMENVFPEIGYRKENFVNISGIGCSSRFPYYMNTFGLHGIHGRANAIAAGVKLANPGLSVWISTGDGDSLAIGGNHFIHIVRRNMDVNIVLFNNQIYGLTKGQYSPTSPMGAITKTSPMGTIEHPFNPGELVIGSQGSFFARVPDNNVKLMTTVMMAAAKHDGCSVIEVLDNCVIFNDKAHAAITGKDVRDNSQLILEHGQPMIFGKERNKGIRLNKGRLEVVELGKDGITEKDLLVHDAYAQDPGIHLMLAKMHLPEFPVAMGVIRSAPSATFNQLMEDQIEKAQKESTIRCVDDLLNSGDTWEI